MRIAIEPLQLPELVSFMRIQADDCFSDLKNEERLNMLAEKWYNYAEFCTCRNEDGTLVGMIAFYANQPGNGVVYIPHVYVSVDYRGQNLMSIMLNTIRAYVKDKGFMNMCLEVHKDNERAQRAYLKYGFTLSGDITEKSVFMHYNIFKL